jgi:RHS repeat-associated protein
LGLQIPTTSPHHSAKNKLDISGGTGVSNVKAVTNTGISANGIGGGMVHNYTYDDLYRLQSANGTFTGANGKTASYTLGMGYDNLHNITRKNQTMEQTGVQFDGLLKAGYNLSYQYADNHQQISNIADSSYRYADGESHEPILKTQQYSYDANGNMLCIISSSPSGAGGNNRKMLWDEENRLLALSDNGFVSNYWYDAAGERTVKTSGDGEGVYVNGVLSGARTGTTNFTAYISPYTVVGNGGQMSKHIYMGSQRIVSKLCNSGTMADPTADIKAGAKDFTAKYALQTANIKTRYDSLGVTYRGKDNAGVGFYTAANSTAKENLQYFYHSDHLGSSSLITDIDGNVAQHIEYIPFGEVFVEERNNSWKTPYKFNGKELDEETGLYYYGARYMDPRTSVWLSVDPLAEKYPNVSSYVYCLNNPINRIDPDGRWVASVFLQGSIGVGLGYGLYAAQQTGIAYDKYGTSHFQTTGVAHITNQDLSGSVKNQNVVWGADAGISAGASIDWKSDSFVESLSGSNQVSVPTSKPSSKVALGIGISGNENSFSLSAGLQVGATLNSMGMKVDESISLTRSEASKVSNMTDVITENWMVRNSMPEKDGKGNITGFKGTVFTKDTNGNYINTGIGAKCGTIKEGNKVRPSNIWMSNDYKKAVNENK